MASNPHSERVEPALLRREQVAKYLSYSIWSIDRLVKESRLPRPFRLTPNGPAMWRKADIDAHIDKCRRSRRPRPEPRGALKATAINH
jgi:predicted DNA-binding transcriptional regulator AlpA